MVLHPPEQIEVDGPVIFLAGPIQGAPDWQSEAIQILSREDSGLFIASPRKDYAPSEFVYERQVDWETYYLRQAAKFGAVMFWLAKQTEPTPERAYAQTSRFELGEWKLRHERDGVKLVVGVEDGFGNARYIARRFTQDCPDVPILSTLEEACHATVMMLK